MIRRENYLVSEAIKLSGRVVEGLGAVGLAGVEAEASGEIG